MWEWVGAKRAEGLERESGARQPIRLLRARELRETGRMQWPPRAICPCDRDTNGDPDKDDTAAAATAVNGCSRSYCLLPEETIGIPAALPSFLSGGGGRSNAGDRSARQATSQKHKCLLLRFKDTAAGTLARVCVLCCAFPVPFKSNKTSEAAREKERALP
ncbi:hypothetical protein NQZ68_027763 [Dissostichus eleginoides]|nr:hypothetical protein NQZ68_027763 [Dissostichus eleginoides]